MSQVRVKDSKGIVHVFDKRERSSGLVHKMYGQDHLGRKSPKKRIEKEEFKASVVPFEPDAPSQFQPYVVTPCL